MERTQTEKFESQTRTQNPSLCNWKPTSMLATSLILVHVVLSSVAVSYVLFHQQCDDLID